jgi:hypothetical protein
MDSVLEFIRTSGGLLSKIGCLRTGESRASAFSPCLRLRLPLSPSLYIGDILVIYSLSNHRTVCAVMHGYGYHVGALGCSTWHTS